MMRIVTDSGTLGHVIKMGAMHLLAYSYSGLFKWAIYTLYHKKTMIIVFLKKKKKTGIRTSWRNSLFQVWRRK